MIGNKSRLRGVVPGANNKEESTVRSYLTNWRRRHADARHDRKVVRAMDAVSTSTMVDEVRAIAQSQFNR
jgi:hypothetical protein